MQNEKEKFKKNFIKRLIKFSIEVLKFSQEIRQKRILWSIIDQLIQSATSINQRKYVSKHKAKTISLLKEVNEISKIIVTSVLALKKNNFTF